MVFLRLACTLQPVLSMGIVFFHLPPTLPNFPFLGIWRAPLTLRECTKINFPSFWSFFAKPFSLPLSFPLFFPFFRRSDGSLPPVPELFQSVTITPASSLYAPDKKEFTFHPFFFFFFSLVVVGLPRAGFFRVVLGFPLPCFSFATYRRPWSCPPPPRPFLKPPFFVVRFPYFVKFFFSSLSSPFPSRFFLSWSTHSRITQPTLRPSAKLLRPMDNPEPPRVPSGLW